MISSAPMTPYRTQPCRRLPIISPKQITIELGSMIISNICTRLVIGVGFS